MKFWQTRYPSGVLSYQSIKRIAPLKPIVERTVHTTGLTYGLGPCSYDIRIAQDISVEPNKCYLVSSIEEFNMPWNICGTIQDKSTWARKFLVFQNTHVDPGFTGYITLEATYHGTDSFLIKAGTPIAQVKFEWLDEPTKYPYSGKYQNQKQAPQEAIFGSFTSVPNTRRSS